MTAWDPNKYLLFGKERTRAVFDLVAHIEIPDPKRIIDLGCGPGNSTQVLRQRWPNALIYGLDNSPAMIDSAKASYPDQQWILQSIEDWSSDTPFDIVFSNAAFHWMKNHSSLTQRLFTQVAPSGVLAFQIPSGAYSPIRSFIHEIAQNKAWVERMNSARTALIMEEPNVYYDALAPLAKTIDIWETEYHHIMKSPAAIIDWISSTGLRPFLDALDSEQEKSHFLSLLLERINETYTLRSDGRILFPFRRTFVIAYKS